jgi:excisionase family DNA binding protein
VNDAGDESGDVMDLTTAARTLGVSRQRVHQLIRAGRLPASWTGSSWVLTRAAVSAYGERPKAAGGPGRRATSGTPEPVRRRKPPTTPVDEIGRTLAISAVAAQVEHVRAMLGDAQARPYVASTLRALWQTPLQPEELAMASGASGRTLTRLRAVCRALREVGLLAEAGDGRLVVDQERIAALARTTDREG